MDFTGRSLAAEPYLTILPEDLTCADAALGNSGRALQCDGGIAYTADLYDRVRGHRLFWGPYTALPAGVYLVRFGGRVEGEFSVDFAHRDGNFRLASATLRDFAKYVCVVLREPVKDLEVRGIKTPRLRSLRLEAVAVHRAYAAPKEARLSENGGHAARDAALHRVASAR